MNTRKLLMFLVVFLAIIPCAHADTFGFESEGSDAAADFRLAFRNEPTSVNSKISSHLMTQKGPVSIWESKQNELVYVVSLGDSELSVVDKNNSELPGHPFNIYVGDGSFSVIANKDDSIAYVTNIYDGSVSVIDIPARKVKDKIILKDGIKPYCQILGEKEHRLYVVARASEAVFVIDTTHNVVADTIKVSDLSSEMQLQQCYSGCHKERKDVLTQAIRRKGMIRDNNTLIIPEEIIPRNGLRQSYQKQFTNGVLPEFSKKYDIQ